MGQDIVMGTAGSPIKAKLIAYPQGRTKENLEAWEITAGALDWLIRQTK
jgi:hypothetical protein